MFDNKTLLITGGTGSFGNAVLNRFLNTGIKEIRIFSRDEKKQDDMRRYYNDKKIKYYIGDVRDYSSIKSAMVGVDYVFHAAALKQVPSCEFYPSQAVQTNILGSENVANAAIASGVKRFVSLSTDKAVYPVNAMGISKAMMEKIIIASSRISEETVFCCTRYGNVMASRGSVIPLFIQQAKENKTLTVTDPAMTRYLMSLDDSVDLVLFAFQHGNSGDIFVQKAPSSTVGDLAQAIIELFKSKSRIGVIGTRHGEKLYETLLSREEMVKAQDMGDYYRVPSDNRDLNYDSFFVEGIVETSAKDDYTSHNTTILTIPKIKELLLKLDYVKNELNKSGNEKSTYNGF
ncbi:MAG: polysaccharide biosynthesis protein [Bacteroidales bacterium]|nr:polysaccharide biosynthesis protein [Bacteroidales bacterium]